MALRKFVVQLSAPLGGALDLELDVFYCSHAYINDVGPGDIPGYLHVRKEALSMSHQDEHSDEKQESEREETVQDLDVSKDEGEDVKGGGLARERPGDATWK
jgi:hypothetical protein